MSCNVYVLIRSSSNFSFSSIFSISVLLIIIDSLSDSSSLSVSLRFHLLNSPPQTGDVITFAHFEEGGLLSETRNDTESSDESDSESLMMR